MTVRLQAATPQPHHIALCLIIASGGSLCCGLAFSSRGMVTAGDEALRKLVAAIQQVTRWRACRASQHEQYRFMSRVLSACCHRSPPHPTPVPQHITSAGPDIVCETSPCVQRVIDALPPEHKNKFWDAVSFARAKCLPNLDVVPAHDSMLLHVPCSAKRMGLAAATAAVAARCCRSARMDFACDVRRCLSHAHADAALSTAAWRAAVWQATEACASPRSSRAPLPLRGRSCWRTGRAAAAALVFVPAAAARARRPCRRERGGGSSLSCMSLTRAARPRLPLPRDTHHSRSISRGMTRRERLV
jgi:hypothetical protein